MANSVLHLSSSLKEKAASFLNPVFIAALASQRGLAWRDAVLALPNLVALFARQILGGNLSMPELARRAGSTFTPEAFCIARGKLPERKRGHKRLSLGSLRQQSLVTPYLDM
jgi:hypothetical protein